MSTPDQPSSMSSITLSSPTVPPAKSMEFETTLSTGRRKLTPLAFAFSRAALARSTLSASTRLLPTFLPCASAKVYAIAPPMSMESHLSRSESMTVILSETFAPPSMTVKGRSGFSVLEPRNSSSFSMSRPATLTGRYAATPAVVACALWAVPKASFT